jgi:hypothetical protein
LCCANLRPLLQRGVQGAEGTPRWSCSGPAAVAQGSAAPLASDSKPAPPPPLPAGATPLAMELLRSASKQEAEVGRTLLKVLAQDGDVASELKAARIRL